MNTRNYDSIVSAQEVNALKEVIFKRARERAESINKEVQESYTSNMQYEIMDLARASFVGPRNPFVNKTEPQTACPEPETPTVQTNNEPENIGFPPRKKETINTQIKTTTKQSSENVEASTIQSAMLDARNTLSNKKSFIGALDFLNSQASISLIKNRGKNFEAIA